MTGPVETGGRDMRDETRLVRWGERALRGLAVANIALGVAALLFILGTFLFQQPFAAHLMRKYGAAAPVMTMIWEVRLLGLLSASVVWPIDRCLRPLADLAASVRLGQPFDPANAGRVTTIGWALLAIQCLDVASGVLTMMVARTGADVVGWQPSLAGWISVPVAFVLARVFAAGARLDADLEGTV
ncbi:hypothetical protein GCM10011380_16720 [Sphingomonas metalli]|uniref:DUF2975 domain-containing protein n=1 Tax=Sphingomonas metalli TaxID=1779358 RepID=A0A916T2Q1_9SPHN|nr:DUF2975 domain-containing protein [Sphingomonas metalli]GGB27758.1 hypothetical protein GCM10011380_16720 [Sphingomonas metalli]